MKNCAVCGTPFEYKNPRKIFCSKECKKKNDYIKYVKAACARFAKNNPERIKAIQEKYRLSHPNRHKAMRQKIRLEALKHISSELKCSDPECLVLGGCKDIRCLQIDHINAGGSRETTEIGNGYRDYQVKYWRHILSFTPEEAKTRYQILCANCNFIKLMENKEFLKR